MHHITILSAILQSIYRRYCDNDIINPDNNIAITILSPSLLFSTLFFFFFLEGRTLFSELTWLDLRAASSTFHFIFLQTFALLILYSSLYYISHCNFPSTLPLSLFFTSFHFDGPFCMMSHHHHDAISNSLLSSLLFLFLLFSSWSNFL